MANMKSQLLISGFGASKQRGGKRGEGDGDTQHGELAGSESPKKATRIKGAGGAQKQAGVAPAGNFDLSRNGERSGKPSAAKPRHMEHETKKVLPSMNFNLSKNGKGGKESPMDRVQQAAHGAKVDATRRWVGGEISSQEHDSIHRRANAVLKHKGRRP